MHERIVAIPMVKGWPLFLYPLLFTGILYHVVGTGAKGPKAETREMAWQQETDGTWANLKKRE